MAVWHVPRLIPLERNGVWLARLHTHIHSSSAKGLYSWDMPNYFSILVSLIVIAHLDKVGSCPVGAFPHGSAVHLYELVSDLEPPVPLGKGDAADKDANISTATALATADGNAKTFSLGLEEVDRLDLGFGHRPLGSVWKIV